MPATPAWPPDSAPRLFVDQPLSAGMDLSIGGPQAHYLLSVMRIGVGGLVKLFDDRTGEWLGEAVATGKRDLTLNIREQLKAREAVPDLWLCAAPIKRSRIDLVAEKASELGVARMIPVITRRSVVDKLNHERLRAHMIEAAEQCERTALPLLDPLTKLPALLRDWPADRHLFFADEEGGAPLRDSILAHPGPAAFLIGPEGGFDPAEREQIRGVKQAVPVSLGPRILRAETAAIAALSVWMAVAGDWA
jgi:16S rRNA (uracil1498-N3)-methyltransferase